MLMNIVKSACQTRVLGSCLLLPIFRTASCSSPQAARALAPAYTRKASPRTTLPIPVLQPHQRLGTCSAAEPDVGFPVLWLLASRSATAGACFSLRTPSRASFAYALSMPGWLSCHVLLLPLLQRCTRLIAFAFVAAMHKAYCMSCFCLCCSDAQGLLLCTRLIVAAMHKAYLLQRCTRLIAAMRKANARNAVPCSSPHWKCQHGKSGDCCSIVGLDWHGT
jgi:hypothetical protein